LKHTPDFVELDFFILAIFQGLIKKHSVDEWYNVYVISKEVYDFGTVKRCDLDFGSVTGLVQRLGPYKTYWKVSDLFMKLDNLCTTLSGGGLKLGLMMGQVGSDGQLSYYYQVMAWPPLVRASKSTTSSIGHSKRLNWKHSRMSWRRQRRDWTKRW
jgi:hypothetical protein